LPSTRPKRATGSDDLVDRPPLAGHAVVAAITALEAVGLAARHGEVARASAAALYFEHLWPVAL
jgi:hypothetical protein